MIYESKLTLATESGRLDIIIDDIEKNVAQMQLCYKTMKWNLQNAFYLPQYHS